MFLLTILRNASSYVLSPHSTRFAATCAHALDAPPLNCRPPSPVFSPRHAFASTHTAALHIRAPHAPRSLQSSHVPRCSSPDVLVFAHDPTSSSSRAQYSRTRARRTNPHEPPRPRSHTSRRAQTRAHSRLRTATSTLSSSSHTTVPGLLAAPRTHTSSIPHVHARHRADRAVASRAHPHSSHARHADTAHSMAPLLYITPRHTARLTRHSPHNVPSLGHTPSDHRCCCCCCSSSGVTVTSKTTTYVSHLDFSLLLRCVCFEQHDDHSK